MLTDKEILEVDFYDLCGMNEIFMTDEDKIKYWRVFVENCDSFEM